MQGFQWQMNAQMHTDLKCGVFREGKWASSGRFRKSAPPLKLSLCRRRRARSHLWRMLFELPRWRWFPWPPHRGSFPRLRRQEHRQWMAGPSDHIHSEPNRPQQKPLTRSTEAGLQPVASAQLSAAYQMHHIEMHTTIVSLGKRTYLTENRGRSQ